MQNRLFGKEDAVFCSYYSGGTETTNKVISGDDKTNPNNNVDYSADIVKDTDPFYTVEETRVEKDPTLEYLLALSDIDDTMVQSATEMIESIQKRASIIVQEN